MGVRLVRLVRLDSEVLSDFGIEDLQGKENKVKNPYVLLLLISDALVNKEKNP